MNLIDEQQAVSRLASKIELVESSVTRDEQELAKANDTLQRTQDAQEILQHLALGVQQQVHSRISEVVSSCLSAVFDDPYQFKIEFERKRGRTEARLRFIRRGLDVDPMTAAGGGMVDVAAFALRVACLVLHRPKLSRVVVLDEPFRFVSVQYQDNIRTMMEQLSQDLKIQIIFVTHNEAYSTGKVIEI